MKYRPLGQLEIRSSALFLPFFYFAADLLETYFGKFQPRYIYYYHRHYRCHRRRCYHYYYFLATISSEVNFKLSQRSLCCRRAIGHCFQTSHDQGMLYIILIVD